MTLSDEWGKAEVRREFTERALARFWAVCEAGEAVPAVLVAVSSAPEDRWALDVVTITDGPLEEVDVLGILGRHLADLIAEIRREQAEEAEEGNGKKGGGL